MFHLLNNIIPNGWMCHCRQFVQFVQVESMDAINSVIYSNSYIKQIISFVMSTCAKNAQVELRETATAVARCVIQAVCAKKCAN